MVLVSWCQFRRQTHLTPSSMECLGQQVLSRTLLYARWQGTSSNGKPPHIHCAALPSERKSIHCFVCVHYPLGILFVQITSTYWCVFEGDDYQMNHPLLAFDTVSLLHNHRCRGSLIITSLHSSSHLLFFPGPFEG